MLIDLVSCAQLRKHFGGVTDMSIWRWLRLPNDPLPQPAAIISGRRYWRLGDIETWLARRAPRRSTGAPTA